MTTTKETLFSSRMLIGYGWMSVAVLIWASWLVLTSAGKITELAVLDLAAFRALIPTLIYSPLLWRSRAEIVRIGVVRCLLLSLYGLPFTLSVGYGLSFAPVAHAGALVPGLMPIFAAVLSVVFLGGNVVRWQLIGFLIILLASLTVMLPSIESSDPGNIPAGHVLFLLGALFWASFTVTAKALNISPNLATAIVGGVSSAVVIPVWLFSGLSDISSADVDDIVFQVIFQGVLSGLISLFAFAQAIRRLGTRVSILSALVPGIAALIAIPVLGQVPDQVEIWALFVVIVGLGIATFQCRATRYEFQRRKQCQVSN